MVIHQMEKKMAENPRLLGSAVEQGLPMGNRK
jgi:hypothetical protein